MAKVLASELRPGMVINHKDALWRIVSSAHQRISGRGGAIMQVEMRGVEDNSKNSQRFRTDEKVERPFVENREMQYLYSEGGKHVFMDKENYEQREVDAGLLEGLEGYLTPDLEVVVAQLDGRTIGIDLPPAVEVEVTSTEPRIKGATATATYKPAAVDTGITVMVPPFIEAGERIRVNTTNGEYIERAG